MYRIEKRWGSFEFDIIGTVIKTDANNDAKTYVKARLDLDGSLCKMSMICDEFIPLENYEKMVNGMEKSMENKQFCEFDLNEIRFYVIPPLHELEINTDDGFADLFESEYGEKQSVITIAIRLDHDEEYDELYPDNEFAPNLQIELEHEDSLKLVRYLRESVSSLNTD